MVARAGACAGKPRAFTLAEVVLALAIVIAISALAFPALDAGGARWDGAQRAISMATIEARAEAMRRGRPVALRARAGELGVELRAALGESGPRVSENAGEAGPILARGEWLGTLPDGAAVERTGEPETSAGPDDGARSIASSELELLTILPGGRVVLRPGWVLRLGERRAEPRVNSWTGEVRFGEIEAGTAGGRSDDSAPRADPAGEGGL